MPSFPTHRTLTKGKDPNAPKISKYYYLSIFILCLSYLCTNAVLGWKISFTSVIVHLICLVIILLVFVITHSKKHLKYQREKVEKEQLRRSESLKIIRETSLRRSQELKSKQNEQL